MEVWGFFGVFGEETTFLSFSGLRGLWFVEVSNDKKFKNLGRALNSLKRYVQTIPWDVTQLPEELENFEEYLEEFDIGITEGEEF